MTPIDLKVKEYMRQFLSNRMAYEKNQTAQMAIGFVLRETEIEKFLDDMWVFINKKVIEEKSNEESK